jgi:sugar phosphate isomerase/epimerase
VSTRNEPFGYCLNTSTIRGQKRPLLEEIEIASRAGYSAIEPWIDEIDAYVAQGGSLPDLKKRIEDAGLRVAGAIGFFEWIVDDQTRRDEALIEARRNMELLTQIGGNYLAAPPMGATEKRDIDLLHAADRYRHLLELGDEFGVVPVVEVWGFSQTLSRLGEASQVAIESGHHNACILADVYHLHKGGSPVSGLRLLRGKSLPIFHVNDYPALPARQEIRDEHRVYPGDGVAPLGEIFRTLHEIGFDGFLSLELFNPEYWKQDAFEVACIGLEKLRASVHQAFEYSNA